MILKYGRLEEQAKALNLGAMATRQSLSTDGSGQSRAHHAWNHVTGVGSTMLAIDSEGC